jgi:hypothetical protein
MELIIQGGFHRQTASFDFALLSSIQILKVKAPSLIVRIPVIFSQSGAETTGFLELSETGCLSQGIQASVYYIESQ